jgi:hypothetical protein
VPFTDTRLYRARALEPVAALGDIVFLLDAAGPIKKYKSPFFAVAGIHSFKAPTPHGLLLLYAQANAAPAGYGTAVGNTNLIPEAASGNIAQSGSVKITNPKILQGGTLQLTQMRFNFKSLAITGVKEHDLELTVQPFGALGGFGLYNATPGYFNIADQFQDPADGIDSPAQGANETLPAAYPLMHPADQANLSEFFWFENNGPTFTIWNNGGAALTAGQIGIKPYGFVYDLTELDPGYLTEDRWVYGAIRKAPSIHREIIAIPTSPYTGQPGQQ